MTRQVSHPPSGEQWSITSGPLTAVLVEVGGGLRSLTDGGRDVVAGYAEDEMARSGRGQLLIPWPNRIRDGRYPFAGRTHELPITERATATASHGLVRWESFRLIERHEDALVLGHTIHPRPGWEHHVEIRVAWRLEPTGLVCTTSATNLGDGPAPFGYGAHPYLALAGEPAAQVRLRVPADRVLGVDPERLLPTHLLPVEGTDLDLREGPALGEREIDHAFTGLARGADGCWQVELTAGPTRTRLWGGPGLDWVQIFTGRASGDDGVAGIAVEPLSCPADAFTSGRGLVVLDAGEQWSAQWGIEVETGQPPPDPR